MSHSSTNHKHGEFKRHYQHFIAQGHRKGQATFNAVYLTDPELANKLRGTNLDCFHNDSLIGEFMFNVYQIWDKE